MKIANLKIAKWMLNYFALCALHFALCTYLAGIVSAADLSNIRVASSINPKEIRIGERVDFRITVEHDSGIDIFYPDESAQLQPFDVLKQRVSTRRSGFGGSATEIVYSLTAFEVGEFSVPPVLITAKDRFGNERNVRTIEHRVKVSLGTETGKDIIDIIPPLDITERTEYLKKALSYLPYIIPFLSAIAVLIFLLSRRREEAVSAVDARGKAIDRLKMLKVDEGDIDALYFDISDILRTFFHEHMKVDAPRMTSAELLKSLKGPGCMEKVLDHAEELFFDLDLVKFSPFSPSLDDAGDALSRAERLIMEVP